MDEERDPREVTARTFLVMAVPWVWVPPEVPLNPQ